MSTNYTNYLLSHLYNTSLYSNGIEFIIACRLDLFRYPCVHADRRRAVNGARTHGSSARMSRNQPVSRLDHAQAHLCGHEVERTDFVFSLYGVVCCSLDVRL